MSAIRKIVCCTDFSANADRAFEVASDMAAERGAHLYLLNVVSGGEGLAASATQTWLPFKQGLLERLEAKYTSTTGGGAEVVVREGPPGRTIVDFVKEQGADLVVVGARGAGAVAGWLGGGSVAEKIVRNSPVPVLVVPD